MSYRQASPEVLMREHPEYIEKHEIWRRYHDLYAGGEQFKANAD